MNQAFILGAGLGTRLRPLTDRLPKPLIPLFHQSLAERAMQQCFAAGARRFAINTHHVPDAWQNPDFFPAESPWRKSSLAGENGIFALESTWNGCPVHLFHEPELLETGGGLKNLSPWIEDGTLLVHNGDIFSTISLEKLTAAHAQSGCPVTLAIRGDVPAAHIALHPDHTRVIDIRENLSRAPGSHGFTGIYCLEKSFLNTIPPREKISVIPAFLDLATHHQLAACVLDDGVWFDLGDRASYLAAHRELSLAPAIHPTARVSPDAHIENSIIGAHAHIPAGARVTDTIVWPHAQLTPTANLTRCIAYSQNPITATHTDTNV